MRTCKYTTFSDSGRDAIYPVTEDGKTNLDELRRVSMATPNGYTCQSTTVGQAAICQYQIQWKKFGVGLSFTPVVLAEGTSVRVSITPVDDDYDPLDAVIGICKDGPRDGAENHDKYIYGDLDS